MKFQKEIISEHYNYLQKFNNVYYMEKYPEFFSEDFTSFCKNKVLSTIKKEVKKGTRKSHKSFHSYKENFLQVISYTILFLIPSLFWFFTINFDIFSKIYILKIIINILGILLAVFIITKLNNFKSINELLNECKEELKNINKQVLPLIASKIENCKYINNNNYNYSMLDYLKTLNITKEIGILDSFHEENRFQITHNEKIIDIGEYFFSDFNVTKNNFLKYQKLGGRILFLRSKLTREIRGEILIQKKFLKIGNQFVDFNKDFAIKVTKQLKKRAFFSPEFTNIINNFTERYKNCMLYISYEKDHINIFFRDRNYYECTNFKARVYPFLSYEKIEQDCRTMIIELKEIIELYTALDFK